MYPVVEQSEGTARRAGELLAQADARAGGESGVGWMDSMVAAVGEGYDEPVLTGDAEDFERLGVGVETY